MAEHLWRIYRYYNPIEDKSYIGQTTHNVNERARNGKAYRKGTKFREAIDKYGWENFEQSILRLCTTQEDADYWEKYFIDKYDAINNGYNTCLGDGGGNFLDRHHTEESRRKISDSQKGERGHWYGQHHSEESIRKMSDSKKGGNNPAYGRHWYTNGEVNFYGFECPEGFLPGRLKMNGSPTSLNYSGDIGR